MQDKPAPIFSASAWADSTSRCADHAAAETEMRELEERLASPDLYKDGDKVKQTTKAFEEVKAHLAGLYEHWEEAVELS